MGKFSHCVKIVPLFFCYQVGGTSSFTLCLKKHFIIAAVLFFFSILIGLQVTYQVLTEFSTRLQEMALTKVLRLKR